MEPLISVIIPVYNLRKVVGKCIESVLNQTFANFEVLIVDDGSTDGTEETCRTYQKDYRVSVYGKAHEGVSAARNYGLEKAKGKWVMFIDGDDYVKPDFFSLLLSNSDADLIVSGVELNQKGASSPSINQVIRVVEENGRFLDEEFCKLYFRSPCAKLFKRDIIVKNQLFFGTALHIGEDTEFVFRFLSYIQKVRFVPACCYCYEIDFYKQASKHAMDAIDVHRHLDAILWTRGLGLLRKRIHYGFPQVNSFLKIYFRRLYFIYLTKELNTYPDFRKEIRNFNELRLRYYDSSRLKEIAVTCMLRYAPMIAYAFLSKYRNNVK